MHRINGRTGRLRHARIALHHTGVPRIINRNDGAGEDRIEFCEIFVALRRAGHIPVLPAGRHRLDKPQFFDIAGYGRLCDLKSIFPQLCKQLVLRGNLVLLDQLQNQCMPFPFQTRAPS